MTGMVNPQNLQYKCLHTVLNMSANTCPFPSGLYTITALTGPVGGGPCGDRIVVKDQSVSLDCFPPFLW